VVYGAGGRDGGLFYQKVPALRAFDAGSPLGVIPAEIAPQPEDVIVTKQYASAFFGTSLASTLAAMKVDTVMIGGFSTSGCVRATTLDALQHGFAPFVVRQACADRDPRPHESNLFDLQAKYAEVIDEAKALALIEG
jgi:nicotinamidase-related amidase